MPKTIVKTRAVKSCNYPYCPSKRAEKVQDDRHGETISRLDTITSNQTELIKGMREVVKAMTLYDDLKDAFDKHLEEADKKFTLLFRRQRSLELKQAWILGVAVGVGLILEGLRTLRFFGVI